MTFAKNLEKAMKQADMTARELADALNINKSSVSQYLSDKNLPRTAVIKKMAQVLHVTVDYLKNGDPKIYEQEEADDLHRSYKNVPISVAALRLGISGQAVRVALKKGVVPFGFCIENGKRAMYHISQKKLDEYLGEQR